MTEGGLPVGHEAVVAAADGEADGGGQEGGAVEDRPAEQFPVLETFAAEDAEVVDGA